MKAFVATVALLSGFAVLPAMAAPQGGGDSGKAGAPAKSAAPAKAGAPAKAAAAAPEAPAIDWSGIAGKEVVLFYPGQSSWEWALTQSDHGGAPKFREGKNCGECHIGEEKAMGGTLVSGKKNEPTPIAGKPGSIAATIKFAHDAQRLYVHLDIAEGSQPDAKQDPKFATKVTMMLDDGKVAEAGRAGCWGTCHEDLVTMPSGEGAERTKYLARSRAKMSRQGGGDALKPAEDLAKFRANGEFLEYWQAKLDAGSAQAANGTVLEKRAEATPAAVTAQASPTNGGWSVTLSRKLTQGDGYKDIVAGKTYTVGFAIHAGHTARRFHYVSFARSLVLDQGTADFVAAAK